MELQPITHQEACEFIKQHHGEQILPHDWKFGIAVNDGGKIIGVITVGRPVSRHKDDGRTLEVTACCTIGSKRAGSKLYEAAWRATNAMGYKQLITYAYVSESGKLVGELGRSNADRLGVSPEERATLKSVLQYPKGQKVHLSDIENLRIQLKVAKRLFEKLGHRDWVSKVSDALVRLNKDDFSFLEDLWLSFARDVDNLIIIAPHLHEPPLTEEQANALNGELAEVANATFNAIDRIKDTRTSMVSSLI